MKGRPGVSRGRPTKSRPGNVPSFASGIRFFGMARAATRRRVTGRPSLAQVRRDIPENRGRSSSTLKMRKAGWTASPRDRAERLYNPSRRPR